MAFVAAGALAMEAMELIGGGVAAVEAAADTAAAVEMVAMEEAVPLMEAAEGMTTTGRAARVAEAYAEGMRPAKIARMLGASTVTAAGIAGGMSARGIDRSLRKVRSYLERRKRPAPAGKLPLFHAHATRQAMARKIQRKTKRAKKAVVKRKQTKASKRKNSKKTVKKKGLSKSRLAVYETHGCFKRNDVSYFGFQNTGGSTELMRAAAETVLKTMFRKFRIQVSNPDETLNLASAVPAVSQIKIFFRRRDYHDGIDDAAIFSQDFNLATPTFKALVESVASTFQTRAESGYFPHEVRAFNSTGVTDGNEVMRDIRFGEFKLALSVTRKIKMRNITPNDGHGTDRFALDTNPLQGVMYKFAGDVPRVREILYESSSALRSELDSFHDSKLHRGIGLGPQRTAPNQAGHDHQGVPHDPAVIMGGGKILSSPPKSGKTIWSNCVSSTRIAMAPGLAVMHRMKYTYNGTLLNFLRKYSGVQYKLPTIGTCHWFGLEQKFKQNLRAASGATTGYHDDVTVEYDIDTVVSGGGSMATASRPPRTVHTDVYNSVAT